MFCVKHEYMKQEWTGGLGTRQLAADKVRTLTSTMAAIEAPNGKLTAFLPAATAKTIATAISAAKPRTDPLISSVRRPTLSTMKTVMMVAISCTPFTMTAAMREPWLPDPSALTPAKIWGAKKDTPFTPDHCLNTQATTYQSQQNCAYRAVDLLPSTMIATNNAHCMAVSIQLPVF